MADTIRIEPLGRDVARVALGTSSMGGGQWAGDNDERRSAETVLHALEVGIDMIDTAPVYGFGLSERIVGRALAEAGARDRTVIATKCGWAWDEGGELRHDASREHVLREVQASLERLQTDRIDLYQLHFPDPSTPLKETAETFAQLFGEGTIRAVGVCNLSAEQMREWQAYAPLHTAQDRYSIFDRDKGEAVLPYCDENGIVFIAYSPLARGLLTGTMRPGEEPADRAHDAPYFHGEEYHRHLVAAERLGDWASQLYSKRLPAAAVRWALDASGGIALWGARRPEHLDVVGEVWDWRLDETAMSDIDRITAEALDTKWVRSEPTRPL
jgi:aryl-alcohol dehydrogenase-like predicted oxidoreductase